MLEYGCSMTWETLKCFTLYRDCYLAPWGKSFLVCCMKKVAMFKCGYPVSKASFPVLKAFLLEPMIFWKSFKMEIIPLLSK